MSTDLSAARLRLPPELNYTFLLLVLARIAAILTAAMVLQYGNGELPCPLCLVERFAMFGICLGIIRNFRHGFSYRNTGYSLLCAIFLLVVAVRQTLLDIYPRPGHASSAAQSSACTCRCGRSSSRFMCWPPMPSSSQRSVKTRRCATRPSTRPPRSRGLPVLRASI